MVCKAAVNAGSLTTQQQLIVFFLTIRQMAAKKMCAWNMEWVVVMRHINR
jgi:hypothetical protein